jgi:hypothetical protein
MDLAWIQPYAGWAAAVGTWVAIIVSILFVRRQIAKAQRAIDSYAFQGISTLWIGIDRFFVDYPELRPYFYDGRDLHPQQDDHTRWRVEATAEMLLDCFTNIYWQFEHMGFRGFERYGRFMQVMYRDQPCFRRWADQHAGWLDGAFVKHLRGQVDDESGRSKHREPSPHTSDERPA